MGKVYYERIKNCGNYENVKIGLEINFDDKKESEEDCFIRARKFVVGKLLN